MQLSLYTDGASHARGNLPGGWAWVLVNQVGPLKCGSGGLEATTNNVMEVTAILEGLRFVLRYNTQPFSHLTHLDVVSDSQYALGVSSGRFQASKNVELVNDVRAAAAALRRRDCAINWHWVRGHNGNAWNERVDRLAGQAKQRVIDAIGRRRAETSTGQPEPRMVEPRG